ncbi:MAG: glycosyltransferase [Acidobacteria bacterium]|nr:glycosyltransferase [Acidobacteriota bacterium]MBI3425546.1 glycosyltransferase [Acidobacteriota bacterium]
MKLGIATICPHIFHDGRWWSYEPLVLELNVWNELFDQLVIVAPQDQGPPPKFWAPYQNSATISVIPFRQDKGRGLEQETTALTEVPRMIAALVKAARQTDAFHLRSPCSISLLGSLLLPLLQARLCAKYAGQWGAYPGEARSYRWQRALLKSFWWRGPVTVYGEWPAQPPHVVPLFTSVLNQEQLARAQKSAQQKARRNADATGLRLLYVGRLSAAKNVDITIEAIAQLCARNLDVTCDIVGDGIERAALENRVRELKLQERVKFAGSVDFERVLDFYERADALVLASETEGWPKAIAEAMAFGLVCIGSDRGLVPWMLGEGRGFVVPPRDVQALADALAPLAAAPAQFVEIGQRAAAWSAHYSLEGLREALRELLSKWWRVTPDAFASNTLKTKLAEQSGR